MNKQHPITRSLRILPAALMLCAAVSCSPKRAKETVIVSAAASLTEFTTEAARAFQKEHPGTELQLNFGASSTLARQIESGAPADIFLSAHPKWTGYLEEKGHLPLGSVTLFRNTLVVAAPGDSDQPPLKLSSGSDFRSILGQSTATGDPEHVPVGIYAREALTFFGVYDSVKDTLIPCADVRSALAAAAAGEADTAIVYRTDLTGAKRVYIKAIFPEESHTPVLYTGGITAYGVKNAKAEQFLNFIAGKEGSRIAEEYGFSP